MCWFGLDFVFLIRRSSIHLYKCKSCCLAKNVGQETIETTKRCKFPTLEISNTKIPTWPPTTARTTATAISRKIKNFQKRTKWEIDYTFLFKANVVKCNWWFDSAKRNRFWYFCWSVVSAWCVCVYISVQYKIARIFVLLRVSWVNSCITKTESMKGMNRKVLHSQTAVLMTSVVVSLFTLFPPMPPQLYRFGRIFKWYFWWKRKFFEQEKTKNQQNLNVP